MKSVAVLSKLVASSLCMLISIMAISAGAKAPKVTRPSAENLMAAEEELAKAFRENNAETIRSSLSDDWAVIVAFGQVEEGKELFPNAIKSGSRTLKTFDVSERRARLNGDTGWVTFKLHLVGVLGGKPFDVMERATDVWAWKDGNWKCVLSHETLFPEDEKRILDEKGEK